MTEGPPPTHSLGHFLLSAIAEKHQHMYILQAVDEILLPQEHSGLVEVCPRWQRHLFQSLDELSRENTSADLGTGCHNTTSLPVVAILQGRQQGRCWASWEFTFFQKNSTPTTPLFKTGNDDDKKEEFFYVQHFLLFDDFRSTLSLLWSGPTAWNNNMKRRNLELNFIPSCGFP